MQLNVGLNRSMYIYHSHAGDQAGHPIPWNWRRQVVVRLLMRMLRTKPRVLCKSSPCPGLLSFSPSGWHNTLVTNSKFNFFFR